MTLRCVPDFNVWFRFITISLAGKENILSSPEKDYFLGANDAWKGKFSMHVNHITAFIIDHTPLIWEKYFTSASKSTLMKWLTLSHHNVSNNCCDSLWWDIFLLFCGCENMFPNLKQCHIFFRRSTWNLMQLLSCAKYIHKPTLFLLKGFFDLVLMLFMLINWHYLFQLCSFILNFTIFAKKIYVEPFKRK